MSKGSGSTRSASPVMKESTAITMDAAQMRSKLQSLVSKKRVMGYEINANKVYDNPFYGNVAAAIKLSMDDLKLTESDYKLTRVSRENIYPGQAGIMSTNSIRLAKTLAEDGEVRQAPVGIRIDGKVVVLNGNHRAAIQLLNGSPALKIKVHDISTDYFRERFAKTFGGNEYAIREMEKFLKKK